MKACSVRAHTQKNLGGLVLTEVVFGAVGGILTNLRWMCMYIYIYISASVLQSDRGQGVSGRD